MILITKIDSFRKLFVFFSYSAILLRFYVLVLTITGPIGFLLTF